MSELQIHVDTEDRSNLTVRGYLDGAEVGYVSLAPMKDSAAMNQDPPVPPNSYMVDISGVATGLQGRGLGTKLYVAAIEEAQKRGIDRVYAGITQSTEAQGVWKKLKILYPTQWDKDWGTYIPLQTGKAVTASDWEPWIGVDLDGTLAKELKEFDPFVIGEPVPAMVEKIKKAIEDGKTVKVLTARMADKEKAEKIAKIIAAWTKKHVGTELEATCEKDPGMEEIWDDKARGVVKNKGVFAAATIKNPDVLLGNYPRNVMGYKAFLVLPNGKIIPPHEGASEHAALLRENGFDDPKQNYGSGKTYEQMFGEFYNKGGLRVSVNNNSTAIQFGSRKAIPLILSLLNHIPTIDAVAEDWKNRILAEGTAKEVEGQLRREMSKIALKLNIKKDSNVAAALADLDAKFPVSPMNPKERVFYAQGQPAVTIEYAEREGRLRIKSIRSVTQKAGLGSLVLERILKVADQHGVTVELTASPFGDEKDRIGGDKLREWYTRFGFHPEQGYDEALGYMVREPNGQVKTANRLGWTMGLCFEWAIAYQELHGGDIYLIRGYYPDPYGDEGDENYEDAHAFISKDGGETGIDAKGTRPVQEMVDTTMWSTNPHHIEIEKTSRDQLEREMEIMPEAIEEAKEDIQKTASPVPRKLKENVTFRIEDDGNYYVCVATNEKGQDIGHLDFEVVDGTRPTGFVRSSGLDNRYQDKGIGFLMYKEAIDFLHKKGVNYFASDQNQNMSGQALWLWDSYLSKQYDVTQFNENDNEFRYIIKTAVRNEEAHKAVALRKQMLEYVMNDPELMFEVGEFRRTFNDQYHRKEDSEFSKLVETYGRPEADRAMQQVREDIENILEQYASGRDGIYPPELAEKVLEAVPDDLLFQFTEARRKEKTAAKSTLQPVPIDTLPGDTISDIAYMLANYNEFLMRAGYDEQDIRANLVGLVDAPKVLKGVLPTKQVYKNFDRKPNEVAVKNYTQKLDDAQFDFDPILVVNGKFYEGGHRMEAYHQAGRAYIPVVDISNLVNAPAEVWEKWMNGENISAAEAFPVKTAARGEVSALYIEVPKGARDHFWEEPPPHNWEFWAFKSHPYALKGERIIFTFNKKPVAESIVHHVEEPGKSKCENTGKYENHWKVYWQPSDFKRYRTAAVQGEKAWISPDGEYNKLRHVHDTHNDYAINVLGMNAKRAMEKGWVRKVGAGVYHAERLTPAAQLTVEKDIMTDNPSMIHIRLEDRGEASFPFSTFIEDYKGDLGKAISRSKFATKTAAGYREETIKQWAEAYEDACFGPGDPAYGTVDDFDWKEERNFDLNRIAGWAAGDYDHLEPEYKQRMLDNWDASLEEIDKAMEDFRQAIRSGTIEEIFVVEGTDGKFYVWEGNHRVGTAHVLGVNHIPAFVGYRKKQKRASASIIMKPFKAGDDDQQRYALELRDGTEIIGRMECIVKPDHLKIHEVNVRSDKRGQGYGKQLYLAAIKLAKTLGLPEVQSDYNITEDAAKVWKSLKAEPFNEAGGSTRYRYKVAATASAVMEQRAIKYTGGLTTGFPSFILRDGRMLKGDSSGGAPHYDIAMAAMGLSEEKILEARDEGKDAFMDKCLDDFGQVTGAIRVLNYGNQVGIHTWKVPNAKQLDALSTIAKDREIAWSLGVGSQFKQGNGSFNDFLFALDAYGSGKTAAAPDLKAFYKAVGPEISKPHHAGQPVRHLHLSRRGSSGQADHRDRQGRGRLRD